MSTTTNSNWPVMIVAAVVGVVLLPFVPLLLALVEHLVFGTDYVEESCRTIGIHDLLSQLYEPLHPLLRYLVD